MSYTIDVLEDYIKLTLSGNAHSGNAIKAYMDELLALCQLHSKNCLLHRVDEYPKQKASTMDFYEVGTRWASRNISHRKYAVLFPENSVKKLDFVMTVALNRGVNVKDFVDLAEAEAWLKE